MSSQPGIRVRVVPCFGRATTDLQRATASRTKGQRPYSNAEIDQMSCKEQSSILLSCQLHPVTNNQYSFLGHFSHFGGFLDNVQGVPKKVVFFFKRVSNFFHRYGIKMLSTAFKRAIDVNLF